MPTSELVVSADGTSIEVQTKANPSSVSLLASRHAIQRSTLLQDIFKWSRDEKWDKQRLLDAILPLLAETLEAEESEVAQAAEYLADEYDQIGDAVLIISRETGRAITQVRDTDIWQPADVPRETGGMARPLARLRPDIEGFLVQWHFDQERERRLKAEMTLRVEQTPLLVAEGDARLLPVTRVGRRNLIEELRQELPNILTSRMQGSAADFLSRFSILPEGPKDKEGFVASLGCTAIAQIRVPLQDVLTFNLNFNRLGHLVSSVGLGWAQDIAHQVSTLAGVGAEEPIPVEELVSTEINTNLLWVAGPDEAMALRRVEPRTMTFVVEGVTPTGIPREAGVLVLDASSYRCEAREVHDRWELVATCDYTVWLKVGAVLYLPLQGVPRAATAID